MVGDPLTLLKLVIAGLVAATAGGLIIGPIMDGWLWPSFRNIKGGTDVFGPEDIRKQTRWFTWLLGGLERFIYTTAWILGLYEAIVVILALKAAPYIFSENQSGSIESSTEKKEVISNSLMAAAYNIRLFGILLNAVLSIVFSELVLSLHLVK